MSTHETVFFARGMLWKGYYCSCYLRKHPRIESQRANKAADKEIHIRTTAFLADHPISSSLPFGFLLLSDFSRNSHAFTAPMPKDVRAEEIHCGAISGSSRTEHLIFHQRGGGGFHAFPMFSYSAWPRRSRVKGSVIEPFLQLEDKPVHLFLGRVFSKSHIFTLVCLAPLAGSYGLMGGETWLLSRERCICGYAAKPQKELYMFLICSVLNWTTRTIFIYGIHRELMSFDNIYINISLRIP